MKKTKKIIEENLKLHNDFEGYFVIIEKIENNLRDNPDICIECCKALLEGIAIKILKKIDNTFTGKELMDLSPLIKLLCEKIVEEKRILIDDDFLRRMVSMVQVIGELRNARGEISHGKAYPKISQSDMHLSDLVMGFTDSMATFILQNYFSLDYGYKSKILFGENEDFNNHLDTTQPMGGILYSEALYSQNYDGYIEELEAYKYDLNNDE